MNKVQAAVTALQLSGRSHRHPPETQEKEN